MEVNIQKSKTQSKALGPQLKTETGVKVLSVTIGRPVEEVFAFFRNLENMPLFMKDLKDVKVLSPVLSRWTIVLKSGIEAEWTAEIVEETPPQLLSWRSLENSHVETAGTVWFEPTSDGQGTVVRLALHYKVTGGKLAELAALLTGEDPTHLTLTNLKRLKALIETGEVPTTEGQPSGREEIDTYHIH